MYFLDILKFKKYLISFNKILKVLKISILMLDLIFLTLFIIIILHVVSCLWIFAG
jgi:hypothetical protein